MIAAKSKYRGLDIEYAPFGTGGVTTDNLFDPNEQVIFDLFEQSRHRYRRAADIGANVGVHSILMVRAGWEVRAYEPDPSHFEMLRRNALANLGDYYGDRLETWQVAVSDADKTDTAFVQVHGNTTANHLYGSREAYGNITLLPVSTVDCRPIFEWADFAKIDCEGHEATLICATTAATWDRLDAVVEVGSPRNAVVIYNHLENIGVPMWAQKVGWGPVRSLEDMPRHHRDGSLFVGRGSPTV